MLRHIGKRVPKAIAHEECLWPVWDEAECPIWYPSRGRVPYYYGGLAIGYNQIERSIALKLYRELQPLGSSFNVCMVTKPFVIPASRKVQFSISLWNLQRVIIIKSADLNAFFGANPPTYQGRRCIRPYQSGNAPTDFENFKVPSGLTHRTWDKFTNPSAPDWHNIVSPDGVTSGNVPLSTYPYGEGALYFCDFTSETYTCRDPVGNTELTTTGGTFQGTFNAGDEYRIIIVRHGTIPSPEYAGDFLMYPFGLGAFSSLLGDDAKAGYDGVLGEFYTGALPTGENREWKAYLPIPSLNYSDYRMAVGNSVRGPHGTHHSELAPKTYTGKRYIEFRRVGQFYDGGNKLPISILHFVNSFVFYEVASGTTPVAEAKYGLDQNFNGKHDLWLGDRLGSGTMVLANVQNVNSLGIGIDFTNWPTSATVSLWRDGAPIAGPVSLDMTNINSSSKFVMSRAQEGLPDLGAFEVIAGTKAINNKFITRILPPSGWTMWMDDLPTTQELTVDPHYANVVLLLQSGQNGWSYHGTTYVPYPSNPSNYGPRIVSREYLVLDSDPSYPNKTGSPVSLGTGDFTIEGVEFVRKPTNANYSPQSAIVLSHPSDTYAPVAVDITGTLVPNTNRVDAVVRLALNSPGNGDIVHHNMIFDQNYFGEIHWAWSRVNGVLIGLINGQERYRATNTMNIPDFNICRVGTPSGDIMHMVFQWGGSLNFSWLTEGGYRLVKSIRVTAGVGRYSGSQEKIITGQFPTA